MTVLTATRPDTSFYVADDQLRQRAEQLVRAEIDFIANDSFLDADEDDLDEVTLGDECRDRRVPRDLPGHLARLCEYKLLTAEEETALFRQMNYLKFKAHTLQAEIEPEFPDEELVETVERLLADAQIVRDRIVQANMRLVMSIVKKFVTPQHSFDDLLSDGIYSLMQAAEKFDYDRGFRFSTYAYRAISRNTFRRINDQQKESSRFSESSEDVGLEPCDDRCSSRAQDDAWDRLRQQLAQFLGRLDRRERFIIRSRYALGAHRKVRTFQCLADKLGVSKERVRQLEQRAVAKLQSYASEQDLDEMAGGVLLKFAPSSGGVVSR